VIRKINVKRYEKGVRMERLTLENVKEMGMYQLAHNHVFVKDGWAWYRDYERELSVIDFIKEIACRNGIELPSDDDEFGDIMMDNLQDGYQTMDGMIAMYYVSLWGMADIRETLKPYEDTGLKPEEIEDLKKTEEYWHKEAVKATAELGELKMKLVAFMESISQSPKCD
jgi:hypothetical protein